WTEQRFLGGEGIEQGNVRAVDGSGARPAVGVEDVAVEPEGALAQLLQINHGTQAAPDQTLDLNAAAIDFPAAVALLAGGGAARQHAVLGAEPALAAADEEGRHAEVDAARAEDGGAPHLHEDAAGGLACEMAAKLQGTEFVGLTAIVAHGRP